MKNNYALLLRKTFSCLFITLLTSTATYSQTPAKWAVTGNTAASGDFLGTTNNEDLVFKTNNTTAFKIKANGNIILKSLEGLGNGIVTIDNAGKLIHLPLTGDTNQVLFGNGTFGSLPNGLWSSGTGGKIYYNGGKVGIGTSTPNFKLDVDGDVRITQNLYLQGGLVISEKIETPKQMKARAIVADSILMDSTKAIYGITNFKDDVKLQSKLSVIGNTTINGNLTANSISTNNFSTSNFSSSTLISANKISAYRLTGMPGDSLVRIGDSTIYFDYTRNRIFTGVSSDGINTFRGLGFMPFSIARGMQSLVFGALSETGNSATRAIVIGSGYNVPNPLVNNIPYSLYIGFKSNIPTLFVSSSAGIGTSGNVSIGGNTNPTYKFQVESGNTDAFLLKTTSSAGLGMKIEVNNNANQAIVVENNGTVNFKVFGDGKVFAREINVQLTTFPDYVFSKNYNLMSINDVSNYIKNNNHLPNMPSAEEVKVNGIGVGELQIKLLEKIEELTLYMIDQDKKLKQIEQDNIVLKNQVEKLKK